MKLMNVYEIVPITKDISSILDSEIVDNQSIFTTSLRVASKLLSEDAFPISNKAIAINTILKFLNYIDNKLKMEDKTTITLSSKILVEYLKRDTYKEYLELLKRLEIITLVSYPDGKNWIKGERCNLYRIHNSYIKDDICLVINNYNKQSKLTLIKDRDYNDKFEKTIKLVSINLKDAIIEEINNHIINNTSSNSLRIRLSAIMNLNISRNIKKGENVDRIYHSLTNLSRISRKFLTVKNKKFNNIDIKNCQPLLLCYLLKQRNLPIDDNYIYDCQVGLLYENFMGLLNRDEVKVQLYKCIYFSFKPNRIISKKFQELYPKTFESLKILSESSETLASQLQNIEASIFNTLYPQKSVYYYTLFDAIYFTDPSDIIHLIDDIRSKFNVYGIKPMLSINDESELDYIEFDIKEL